MQANKDIVNILIAGTGGQGVNTLYRILLGMCTDKNLYTKSALYKGGAQRHGTVYATLRVFLKDDADYLMFSSQVPLNGLDILIGLEPWETLRFMKFCGQQTQIYTNTTIVPLFSERFLKETPGDPVEIIRNMAPNLKTEDYTGRALQTFGDRRMANYLMAKDVVESGKLPFTAAELAKGFINTIKPDKQIEKLITEKNI
jgi:Pyruvate/2-oxoacid:ferredoxin oxidoreductase gamma subunit